LQDVVIVGAGPAGIAAAKRCAEYGLDTLVLEKRTLPRDKVCSGMIMGPVAHTLIKQEFGYIPDNVLTQPNHLIGYTLHVPGVGKQKFDSFTPLTWRRNLDYWMSQKAKDKGTTIVQAARVIGFIQNKHSLKVEFEREGKRTKIETRFLIGSDGTNSTVRNLLYPELNTYYTQIYQECHQGELNLDKRYFHWFFPIEINGGFAVHQKDGLIVVDFGSNIGMIKQVVDWSKDFLSQNYNFNFRQRPHWRSGCVDLQLWQGLFSHTFLPAKGNVLLVGDASGIRLPLSGEGIGTALKSGLLAADSIISAIKYGVQPDRYYLDEVDNILTVFRKMTPQFKRIDAARKRGGASLHIVLAEAYRETLISF